jgi:hypothetical protein
LILKEIIKWLSNHPSQTILYQDGWFITGIVEERGGYIIRARKYIEEVKQSIVVAFYCSSSIIEEDDGKIALLLDSKLRKEIDELKKIEESNKRPG